MIEALVRRLDRRWIATPELPVPAARGVIDLALRERGGQPAIACEAQSQLRALELVLRRLHATTLARGPLPWPPGTAKLTESTVSSLLLLRSTVRNRDIVRLHGATLAASFPGGCREAIQALAEPDASWPGATLLWVRVDKGRAELLDRPPRQVTVGR